MTNSKNTKRALLSSVLAMLVCVAMLVGSTFAWFTDSVSTGKSRIVAGNLDVDLVDAEGNSLEGKVLNFVKAEGAEDEEILWEPGCTYNLPEVSVKNNGNLALKYRIVVNGVEGDEKLLEAIEFTAKLGGEAVKLDDYVGHLEKGETSAQPLVISGHMKETAGNEYKGLTAEGISITVIAAQDTVESDSFNNQYDENANYGISVWDGSVTAVDQLDKNDVAKTVALHSAADLAGFAAAINNNQLTDYTVTLDVDVDLNGLDWTPIATGSRSGSNFTGNQFAGTFDGNGKTISGLTIEKNDAAADDAYGLFGIVNGGTIKNLKLEDVKINLPTNEMAGAAVGMLTGNGTVSGIIVSGSVSANRGNGGVVGRMIKAGTISDCVNNATVTADSTNLGGIAGAAYYTSDDGVMTINNCANNGEVKGSNGYVGGIAGFCAANVTNCTNTAAVTGNGTSVGGIIGEQTNYGTVSGCTNTANIVNNSTLSSAYGTGGIIGWVRYKDDATNYPKTMPIVIKGNTNSGDIIGAFSAGGIVGHVFNTAEITENINTASQITASVSGGFAAGIAGSLQKESGNKYSDALNISVNNNISTTSIDNINGGLKSQYAYNNSSDVFIVENNKDTLS